MVHAPEQSPALVTLDVWGVRRTAVPRALFLMATQRRAVCRLPGVTFAKLLGTGRGETFGVRDADPLHWALLLVWRSSQDAKRFATSDPARAWARIADEQLHTELEPLGSHGRWSGREPFGTTPAPRGTATGQPVAAITRARLAAPRIMRFWRAVPPVAADLHAAAGLKLAFGIGEAPVGLQGTFSVWDSADALRRFAYEHQPHADVIRRTRDENWYAEELFARFRVVDLSGTWCGVQAGATSSARRTASSNRIGS